MDQRVTSKLGLSEERAAAVALALGTAAKEYSDGRLPIHDIAERSNEDPEVIKDLLVALLITHRVNAKFVPYHRPCDQVLGPDEDSEEEIKIKFESNLYPSYCPNCHDEIADCEDIVIKLLFYRKH